LFISIIDLSKVKIIIFSLIIMFTSSRKEQ